MHIGLFPGSFKPPHKGHLQMVKDAIRKDKLDKVVIIISKYPRYLDDKIQIYKKGLQHGEMFNVNYNRNPKERKLEGISLVEIMNKIKE